jgi:uncharacterized DUF497 family protein
MADYMYIYTMEFEWGEKKDYENIIKHGVSFSEAQNAFLISAEYWHLI